MENLNKFKYLGESIRLVNRMDCYKERELAINSKCLYSGDEHTPIHGNSGIIYCAECGEILND